jgi:hypothetical protein
MESHSPRPRILHAGTAGWQATHNDRAPYRMPIEHGAKTAGLHVNGQASGRADVPTYVPT